MFFRRAWIPREINGVQDWTWGGANGNSPRFFLNTDMCLLFDIETTFPCCTRTDLTNNNGNQCDRGDTVLSNTPCASYAPGSVRAEAANAVELFAGLNNNGGFNNDNSPFYDAFTVAWNKATTNGLSGLQPLVDGAPIPPPPPPEPSSSPTAKPTQAPIPISSCVSQDEYDAIDADIASVSAAFGTDNISRAHFLGGILRLAAHDFLDFDVNDVSNPMGADGCIDFDHADNSGFPQDVWCDECPLTQLHRSNFLHLSKADFWVAAANAVIRIASNNELDPKSTYVSGRVDTESCDGQGSRLPAATGCDAVEGVFVDRMNMTLTDGVALLGAHTIGRGDTLFSGHHGIWVDTEVQSVVSTLHQSCTHI